MMYENRVAAKKFGADPQNLTWWEFWKITQDIFGEAAAGPKTWQRYFGKNERESEKAEGAEQEKKQQENGKEHIEKQTDETEEQITGQMEIQDCPEIAPEDKQPEEIPQSPKGGIEDKQEIAPIEQDLCVRFRSKENRRLEPERIVTRNAVGSARNMETVRWNVWHQAAGRRCAGARTKLYE